MALLFFTKSVLPMDNCCEGQGSQLAPVFETHEAFQPYSSFLELAFILKLAQNQSYPGSLQNEILSMS
jgi:hypothetical protein